VVPSLCADRYRGARVVAFSTGNVYGRVPNEMGGPTEADAPAPVGEYAWSCLGRERVLGWHAARHGTRVSVVRLNYAVDLRYGVLVDVARKVMAGEPVDVTMGYVNVIWQGDANTAAIAALPRSSVPPYVVNVTGLATLSVRAVALRFAELFAREAIIAGREAPDALLSNAGRMRDSSGAPSVDESTLIDWVAGWLRSGGRTLAKPTHFEARDGRF
jgi:nucleoside-diphosphate-sugar epimerase